MGQHVRKLDLFPLTQIERQYNFLRRALSNALTKAVFSFCSKEGKIRKPAAVLAKRWQAPIASYERMKKGDIDFRELRRLSKYLYLTSDHVNYERVLKKIDPWLNLPKVNAQQFVGSGAGMGSLNCYRRVVLDGVLAFEKVYEIESDAFRKLDWFHQEVLPKFLCRISTPAIRHVAKGNKFAVVYFEYLDCIKPAKPKMLFSEAIRLHCVFAGFDPAFTSSAITEFEREIMYDDGVRQLKRLLERTGHNVDHQTQLEWFVSSSAVPRVFAHGDLIPPNFSQTGHLLDFDKCGFYPIGYDIAYMLSKRWRISTVSELERVLDKQSAFGAEECRISILYFAAVFYARRPAVAVSENFPVFLFERALELMHQLSRPCTDKVRVSCGVKIEAQNELRARHGEG